VTSGGWDSVHLVRRPLTGLPYQPRMIEDECGAVDGMRIDRGNRSTRRKLAPMPPCPPQIPHDLTWARARATAVGSRRLTAWAMARPKWPLEKTRPLHSSLQEQIVNLFKHIVYLHKVQVPHISGQLKAYHEYIGIKGHHCRVSK
jgi:hypothetical protein